METDLMIISKQKSSNKVFANVGSSNETKVHPEVSKDNVK